MKSIKGLTKNPTKGRGRPSGTEKARTISMRVPKSRAEELELFAHSRGLKLAGYCQSLVWTGFQHDKKAAA